jgi:hypothetical protein
MVSRGKSWHYAVPAKTIITIDKTIPINLILQRYEWHISGWGDIEQGREIDLATFGKYDSSYRMVCCEIDGEKELKTDVRTISIDARLGHSFHDGYYNS